MFNSRLSVACLALGCTVGPSTTAFKLARLTTRPRCAAERIATQLVLAVPLTAEVLPVRVFARALQLEPIGYIPLRVAKANYR